MAYLQIASRRPWGCLQLRTGSSLHLQRRQGPGRVVRGSETLCSMVSGYLVERVGKVVVDLRQRELFVMSLVRKSLDEVLR